MDFTILEKLVDFLNEPNLPQVETSREDDEKKEEENKIVAGISMRFIIERMVELKLIDWTINLL